MDNREQILEDLKMSVVTWNLELVKKSTIEALESGLTPGEIILEGLSEGMAVISKRFDEGNIFLPQVVAASRSMQIALEILEPHMKEGESFSRGCVIIGSVRGDIHEIGKDVCCAMLRGAGYTVVDLGGDVKPSDFYDAAQKNNAKVIGASALMTTTLMSQRDLVKFLNEESARCKVTVGGAPCSSDWCEKIGADAYSATAAEIVEVVGKLMKNQKN